MHEELLWKYAILSGIQLFQRANQISLSFGWKGLYTRVCGLKLLGKPILH